MMNSRCYFVAFAFSVVLIALPGCQKSPMNEANHSQRLTSDPLQEEHRDEEDDQDHEHLEHFVPPHKPASFEELVSQLAFRCESLPQLAEADEKEFQKRSIELRDIIQWIPELSADSNLQRQEFETAVEEGKQLLQAFESSDAGRSLSIGAVQKNLDALKSLVPESIEPVPAGQTPEASMPSSPPEQ